MRLFLYLVEFTGTSLPTVDKALLELCDKNYIIKTSITINNVVFNRYKVNIETLRGVKKLYGGSKETLQVPSITNPDLTVTAKLKDELDSLRKRLKDEEIVSGIEAIPEKPDEPPITIRFSVDEMAYFLNTKKRSRVRS